MKRERIRAQIGTKLDGSMQKNGRTIYVERRLATEALLQKYAYPFLSRKIKNQKKNQKNFGTAFSWAASI